MSDLRSEIAKIIGIDLPDKELSRTPSVPYTVLSSTKEDGYTLQYIKYTSGLEQVPAYLLLPDKQGNNPAVLIHHQHDREHHLGKSEVCGLAGNPLQAFGSALAKKGFVVLAPDAVCFEERRANPTVEGFDFWQHFDEVCYRIIKGKCLMQQVLTDAMSGISLLFGLPYVDKQRIGTMGHSMGGNTVLFLTALDERISFACASGSACTYEYRMANGVGIELSSVIPGFHGKYDIDDLVSLTAPRKLLLVSAKEDKYSMDAPAIVEKARLAFKEKEALHNLYHKQYPGGHALTQERFDFIIEWLEMNV
ncbi:MAG: acetylxylan esterase [Lachnospiraceae bacterium]|nr:acetylxylan esterase [Lachnospiraceae bacterium]